MPSDIDDVAAEFADLASWCEGSSPRYERLCAIVANDDVLLEVAAQHNPGQPAPQLFLAAVQAELFASDETGPDGSVEAESSVEADGSVDADLARYYPSVVADPVAPDDDLAEALRAFVDAHEGRIRDLVRSRRVQTNAVRRCSALYPGYATVAEHVDDPIALLEVGSSAGLNQNWDRYRYEYQFPDGETRRVGDPESAVTIEAHVREDGATPTLLESPPGVVDRVGIDVNPLDPTAAADARWLRALVWPEHHDRRRVLDGALEVAREHPPTVVEGDAVTDLEAVASRLPDDAPLVVSHSLVLYQLDDDAREAFIDAVDALASDRDAPTYHLAGERPDPERDNAIQLRLARVDETDTSASWSPPATLGAFEQHGAWITWQDSGTDGDGLLGDADTEDERGDERDGMETI